MEDKKEKCTALVYEPKPLSLTERWQAMVDRKKEELIEALEKGQVRDPISTLVAIGIQVAVSAAVSYGSSPLARALMPRKGKPIC